MENAKINFDWPLDLLRSETVEVYVNNEINILIFFSEPSEVQYSFKCALVLKIVLWIWV